MKKKIYILPVIVLWLLLTVLAWCLPSKNISLSERRSLQQFPALSGGEIFSGRFMEDFEDYTLDQFPLRDSFRSLKALYSRYVLGKQDNNGIYVSHGHIAELGYPLDEKSVTHALQQFQKVYDLYLTDNPNIYTAIVPDKGYYLRQTGDHLSMDYETLFSMVQSGMPYARHIDLTEVLTLDHYYRTDTHWRQEAIGPVAQTLGDAMGFTVNNDYTPKAWDTPFYGVYYGQSALPARPDTLYLMENEMLSSCRVYDFVTDSYTPVYNRDKLSGYDPYDVYLSGAQSLLRLENPGATTDRELILFRDSFGSSLAPLLVRDYAAITLIDIRYIQPQQLGNYVDFENADILFLYSTLVLNKNLI